MEVETEVFFNRGWNFLDVIRLVLHLPQYTSMKSIRILLACSLAAFASASLVRAQAESEKKDCPPSGCCPSLKKDVKKCSKDAGCSAGACEKPEKSEAPKTTS